MATENLHYEERLRRLGLTTLQQRRLRGDLIETYKIVTVKKRIETKNFFTFHVGKYNTRGHCYKLETKRSRLELRQNFFSQRVVVHWNKLPESVVTAESVNAFKNRLNKEWGNQSSRWTPTPCPTSTSTSTSTDMTQKLHPYLNSIYLLLNFDLYVSEITSFYMTSWYSVYVNFGVPGVIKVTVCIIGCFLRKEWEDI